MLYISFSCFIPSKAGADVSSVDDHLSFLKEEFNALKEKHQVAQIFLITAFIIVCLMLWSYFMLVKHFKPSDEKTDIKSLDNKNTIDKNINHIE